MALRRTLSVVVTVTFLLVLPGAVGAQPPVHDRDRLFGPQAAPAGVSYDRWFARWAAWLQKYPASRSPIAPNSPNNCEQRPNVVFIGPNGTGKDCSVPRGKPVGLTFVGQECSTAEGNGETYRELRRCAVAGYRDFFSAQDAAVRLKVDGNRIERPRRWTFTSSNRMVTLPKDNIWGAPAGPTKTVSHGLFYMLKPLAPGEHLVRFRTKSHKDDAVDIIRYRFTVRTGN